MSKSDKVLQYLTKIDKNKKSQNLVQNAFYDFLINFEKIKFFEKKNRTCKIFEKKNFEKKLLTWKTFGLSDFAKNQFKMLL